MLMLVEDKPMGEPVRSFRFMCQSFQSVSAAPEEFMVSCGPPIKGVESMDIEVGLESVVISIDEMMRAGY